jgi:hypothetical protein
MLRFGNHKLGDDTAIFNMSTATDCPSKKLGLCEVHNQGIKCYAFKAEQQYPNTVPNARKKQHEYWKTHDANKIASDFIDKITRRRKETRFFRFNESGDFEDQSDVDKLNLISLALKEVNGITTYGYTARRDLDFSKAQFLVKGSSNDSGNNGKTIVIGLRDKIPEGFIECPGGAQGCSKCNLCKIDTKLNIAFRKH